MFGFFGSKSIVGLDVGSSSIKAVELKKGRGGLEVAHLGLEALAVEKAVLHAASTAPGAREIVPPEWAPWSLLSIGAITVLYSFTIPARAKTH